MNLICQGAQPATDRLRDPNSRFSLEWGGADRPPAPVGLPRWLSGKESACKYRRCKRQVQSLGQEDPLEEEMATHSSILAW